MECILNQVDPQFETSQGFNYRLSILLCQDGFSFLVTHAVSQKMLRLAAYKLSYSGIHRDELGGWPLNGNDYFEKLEKIDLTRLAYQRVDIAIATQKITVAPPGFIGHDDAPGLVSVAFPVSQDEEIITEPVFDQGPVTALIIPRYIPEYCEKMFPGAIIWIAAAVFVKGVLRKHSRLIARQVFINIHPGFFEITVIQGLRLLYLNAFRYSAPSDVLYYVIFVLEQLGFVPSEEYITLMGEISDQSVIYTQLQMYCKSLRFAEQPEGLAYGEAFEKVSMHDHFILLNIPVCE